MSICSTVAANPIEFRFRVDCRGAHCGKHGTAVEVGTVQNVLQVSQTPHHPFEVFNINEIFNDNVDTT